MKELVDIERASNFQQKRKGFLAEAVPVAIKGIAGPGAPHQFCFDRREALSNSDKNISSTLFV